MTETIPLEIGKQLNKLRQSIVSHNKKGDLCGLFSHHILSEAAEWREGWDALCDKNWLDTQFDEKNVYLLSSFGYSLSNFPPNDEAVTRFTKAFDLLMQRDPFKGPHVSFPYQPITLIGLILGINVSPDEKWKQKVCGWLTSIINKRVGDGGLTGYQELQYNYAKHLLDASVYEISVNAAKGISIEELSILEYCLMRNIFRDKNQVNILSEISENLIEQIVKGDISGDVDEKAALIWIAVNESISTKIGNYLLSPNYVSAILSRFEDAMKRWRYDPDKLKKPVRWPIESEREIQDILWLVLRSYFDDLIDEEALPKFGHKFYKPDFAIPSLRLLIEVKYAYQKDDFKKLEQEIMVDTIAYLSNTKEYDRIIVFIYDESSSVQEHGTTRKDLKKLDEIEDVIIVSKPSQIVKEGVKSRNIVG